MIDRFHWYEKLLLYAAIFLFLLFLLLPFIEAFMVSLRPIETVFHAPYRFITPDMGLHAYTDMITSVPMLWRYMFNSFFISSSVTVLTLICSVPAAYALARFRFKGRGLFFSVLLVLCMVGAAILIVPLYKLMMALGLLNTYAAMIIPGAAFLVPAGIFFLRAYLRSIPRELEDAAYVDGATRLYILWRIVLPLAMPAIMVEAITCFIAAYAQQFLFALIFNSNSRLHPLSMGLFEYFGRQRVEWDELMAASLIGIVPVLILYIFLQRYIVVGLMAGAVKQ